MATKFKRKEAERNFIKISYQPVVYKQRSISIFMLTLCLLAFIGSSYFITKYKEGEKTVYTEGIIVEKSSSFENNNDLTKPKSFFITVRFPLRSGKFIIKQVPVDEESFEILSKGDVIPINYRYDYFSRNVEVISFGRYPLRKSPD
ncbi:MAG: hypothetical protein N3G21_12595 [Candidatus Hydrogenedentes bacterium]|nr:hypothetical protein [Candidatus Hydrogenedentota bacterium]